MKKIHIKKQKRKHQLLKNVHQSCKNQDEIRGIRAKRKVTKSANVSTKCIDFFVGHNFIFTHENQNNH